MILTRKILEEGKSLKGGWSNLQIELLGVKGFVKGWPKTILGKDYPESVLNDFLSLKDKHLKESQKTKVKTIVPQPKKTKNITIVINSKLSDGNPGKGYCKAINYKDNSIIFEHDFDVKLTNNILDYLSIVAALKYCKKEGIKNWSIYSNNKYAIHWVYNKKHNSNMHVDYPSLYTEKLGIMLKSADTFLKENKGGFVFWWNKYVDGSIPEGK